MSSEIITSNDLKKILASAFPARANTTITEVTLPYTPPCNGILFGQLRAEAQGRAYKHMYNATPDLWDFYQVVGGYATFASFVEKNKVVSERAVANLQQQFYYFMPLDGTSPLFGGSADAVVEQGTSGIWTYRKWNSGIAECWGAPVVSSGTYTVNINLPFSFIDKTSMCVQLTPLESGTSWNINYASSTTSQINFGRTPNTATNNYYMYVKGTWK